MTKDILGGTVHKMPKDLKMALLADDLAQEQWGNITPLARNEFICWIISPVKSETRAKRIRVAIDKLNKGERRPCCWIGCIHRTDKELSPSIRGIIEKRKYRQ